MKKIKGNPSLYERILKSGTEQDDKLAFQAFQAFQDDLSLCNNSNNPGTYSVTPAFQERSSEQMIKQEHPPELITNSAELIPGPIKYLAGITEDLTGWSLWKRIEDGKEHRFAKDPGGAIRWERWYELEPRVII